MSDFVRDEASAEALLGLNRAATTAKLLSGAIHEVNNALQVIAGTVEILETQPNLPQPVVDALVRLKNQSGRAAGALGDVLTFTKGDRTSRGVVNLRELVTHSLALRAYAMRRARITCTLDVGEGSFTARGNRVDLQQALLNLLINAEQALRSQAGTITVRLAHEGGQVLVGVHDSGPGIQVEDPFVAWRSTGPPADAAGLGLWAARLLVESCGGTLAIERVDQGTSIVMRLPA